MSEALFDDPAGSPEEPTADGPPDPSEVPPDRPAVLVTGGSGPLGSLVVDALVRDPQVREVVAVDRHRPALARPRVVEVTDDLGDLDLEELLAMHAIEAVVHLPTFVDAPPDRDDHGLGDAEVAGTRGLVEAAVAAGVDHLTVAGSGTVYGHHRSNRGRRLDEDAPLRGKPGAAARQAAEIEQLLTATRRRHPELGQLVLRLAIVLGSGTDDAVPRLFRAPVVPALSDAPIVFSFAWDTDVARVIRSGVVERRTGIYNVAGDGVVTLREVAALQGKRTVSVPSRLAQRTLELLARRELAPFGPEQVDLLRDQPVLANDRLQRDFPGVLTRSARDAFLAWSARTG